jgi:hypothetical protein
LGDAGGGASDDATTIPLLTMATPNAIAHAVPIRKIDFMPA